MSDTFFAEHLAETPIIGIFRSHGPDATERLCHMAWQSGVRLVEVPVQDTAALPSLERAVAAGREAGRAVGAGSVVNLAQLDTVLAAGAEFVVCPGAHLDVMQACADRGVPILPGVATATEIATVLARGQHWMKAFPASVLGAAWVRAQLGPFPDIAIVATGGVDHRNGQDFLEAGCRALAVGSAFDPTAMARLREMLAARDR